MAYYNVTHKQCDDGSMSAAIVKKFKPDAIVFFTTYGNEWKKELKLVEGDKVLFTDFCPDPKDLVDLMNRKIEFTVLDHHETAQINLDKFWEEDPKNANLIRSLCKIDKSKCGATLTWDFFNQFKQRERPKVLDYIEIADIWKWERNPNAIYVTQYIRIITKVGSWMDMAELLENFDEEEAIEKGKMLHTRLMADVEQLVEKSSARMMFGKQVRVCNSGHGGSISELGHELAKLSSDGVGLVFNILGNKVKLSTRGLAGTTVARELAEKFGGGGHNEAAGAFLTLEAFMKIYNNYPLEASDAKVA